MILKEMIKEIPYKKVSGSLEISIDGLFIDSRKVSANGIYFAIKGFNVDGHNFIHSAIKNGAVAIVCEDYVENMEKTTIIQVENVRQTLAIICKKYYDNPTSKIDLFGVTGTNGKTSVTYFLEEVLMKYKKNVGLIGTIQSRINKQKLDFDISTSTTPDAIELNILLNKMIEKGADDIVMEVSSHALELSKVDGARFKVAMFTNLTQDHLDMHKNMENYCKAKSKLFTMCEIAIINIDDKYADKIIKGLDCKIIKYSIEKESDLQAINIRYYMDKVSFDIKIDDKTESFILNIPGRFSIYNALCTIGASIAYGIPLDIIKEGISSIEGVAGRIQNIKNNKGFNVIVDYAHTPDGLENIIKSVREFTKGDIITIFGCGGDRDNKKRPIMGDISGRLSDYTIITSDNPRSEEPNSIIDDIEKGIINTTNMYEKIADRREAIFRGIKIAKELDTIIIAGKGHEDYEIFKDKTIHFDDTEVAREALGGI